MTEVVTNQKAGHVHSLIAKAAASGIGIEAMQFSQAALNAANALCSLQVAAQQEQKLNEPK